MSDSGDNVKYKWTPESTSLLVSVWSDGQVQKQLEYATKPQLNSRWESIARYMKKKGYNVSGKQCRSRMKQVLVCYREAKRAGTRAGVEQYYEQIDTVLKNKLMEEHNINGIDTVDAMVNAKSPLKEEKTNKNMQMRHRFQEPVPSLHRTEALSPTWILGRENEYPDSPESNETVIAQPYRMFSPTRDVAINTGEQLTRLTGRSTQCNMFPVEEPLCVDYKQNLAPHYNYREIPFQNAVQNVQNQIIQENMQQNQNHMYNRQNALLVNNLNYQQNLQNLNQGPNAQPVNVPVQINPIRGQNPNIEQIMQHHQNQLQQIMNTNNNRAMPQEPRKAMLEQNMCKQNYGNFLAHMPPIPQTDSLSPDYSPDVSQNLNDAFCQSKGDDKTHNLNETFNRNLQPMRNPETTVMTNNATCNDESFLEFLIDSPTPLENDNKSKDTAVNTEMPHAPFRKKKAQKLEQLVLSAINSQNEVVNKILSAQNDMVSKFMDIDRDRQNRLENRLDDLLKVVHASMLGKQGSETDVEIPPPPPEPTITSLAPPPRPGMAPPKLDLVPPKPCRVPCTMPSSNVELINQNTVTTRPGVVSPISSPVKRPGTIWSKLGPVSQSPFVKAQQRLGFQPIASAAARTQSSAERRIAREVEKDIDPRTVMFETQKLLEAERQLEEKIENARLESALSQTLHARRRLFTQREPTPAMILTAAFLENECRAAEQFEKYHKNKMNVDDNLLAGHGESYDRLRRLNVQPVYSEPCDTSTPAKLGTVSNNNATAKPTIQQLAQVVMNAGRWKDAGAQNGQANVQMRQTRACPVSYNDRPTSRESEVPFNNQPTKNDQAYVHEWMMNKHGYPTNDQKTVCNAVNQKPNYPMGFIKPEIGNLREEESNREVCRPLGFSAPERKQSVRFAMDEALAELQRMYIETVAKKQQEMNDSLPYVLSNANPLSPDNRQMIEKYMHEMIPRKDKDTDSDNDEEFLDTTATMPAIAPRRNSLTSNGTGSTETAHSTKIPKLDNCVVS